MRMLPALALAGLLATDAMAEIYMYTNDKGEVIMTDTPPWQLAPRSIGQPRDGRPAEYYKYQPMIQRIADRHGVDSSLVNAVIQVESSFRHDAVSRSGAQGLMQLMPSTARNMGVRNPFDPEDNVEGGVKYLKGLIERFSGDVTLALAAYNIGPLHVEKYGDVPPIYETKRYLNKVFAIYKGTRNLSANGGFTRHAQKDGSVLLTNRFQKEAR